ncbi:hypothetical protein VP01_5022g1, partial [Puccinia sorghi]
MTTQSTQSPSVNPAGYVTTPVKRPKNDRMIPLILKTNHKSPQYLQRRKERRLPRTQPLAPNKPWTLAHPRLFFLLKTWTMFDDVKNLFSEPYFCKGDVRINYNLLVVWQPDNKPLSYKCLWCTKKVCVSGSSLSNLLTHQDGSRQTGRVSDG